MLTCLWRALLRVGAFAATLGDSHTLPPLNAPSTCTLINNKTGKKVDIPIVYDVFGLGTINATKFFSGCNVRCVVPARREPPSSLAPPCPSPNHLPTTSSPPHRRRLVAADIPLFLTPPRACLVAYACRSYDPAYMNTCNCTSTITYLDGDKGQLLYRGIPIEQLAEKSDYLESAFLVLFGELPTGVRGVALPARNYLFAHLSRCYHITPLNHTPLCAACPNRSRRALSTPT